MLAVDNDVDEHQSTMMLTTELEAQRGGWLLTTMSFDLFFKVGKTSIIGRVFQSWKNTSCQ
jgi:hypothetical protein